MAARRTTHSESKPRQTRKPRRREVKLAFEALTIEGGLLSPDWLARVAALNAGGQGETDYRVPKGLQLRDEIGRYWRIAQAYWSDFAAGRASAAKPEAAQALAERFVLALLRESFGFGSLTATEPLVIAERSYPIGFTAVGGRVPVVIASAGHGLDILAPALADGGRRRSAFGLAQEYLNAAEGATWGLASDGLALRILRDNASLTRPAWIEADLERIFTEERYSDFAALWLLAHETRFGRADQPPTECALEIWRDAGRDEGTRAREHLRSGVEEALVAFGQGFLTHSENTALRAELQDGALSPMDYFQELLRLVYRLIFLLTVEERGLLHPEDSAEGARRLYAQGYGLRRLRERSIRRSSHDRFSDLWEATKIVFRGVAAGEPLLALPALAGIFAPVQCPTLDVAKLENRALLLAVFHLSWLREASGLVRVNWRDMGPEELGSVYESLLELVPQVTQGGRLFAFATGSETKGNARKTSGSYYTPDSLVQVLLDSALEPVVAQTLAVNPERSVEALLELSIVDPACGSGHFLLAAARRLAGHVARFQVNGTPSAAEYRHAIRQVVGRCLYGVDLNPMAVELCKVSLWMEAVEPGLPLTFLDAHIRHGNALLGTTPELMADGIPDAAWSPIEGDDRKVASGLKKRNKRSEGGQRALDTLWTKPAQSETAIMARAVAEFEAAPDTDLEALARKEGRWEDLLDSEAYRHQKLVADAWCAAFVWPKQPGPLQDTAPTNDVWLQIRDRKGQPNPLTVATTNELAKQYRFFHWHLAFPQVFGQGGFDVVLGNPPWERLTIRDQEWFAGRDSRIANSTNAAERKRRIKALVGDQPELSAEYQRGKRASVAEKFYSRNSGYFPLTGLGDVNTYALFAETAQRLSAVTGFSGLIVPSGIATTDTTKLFFSQLVTEKRLRAVYDFDNRSGLFPGVQGNVRFCLLVTGGTTNEKFRVAAQLRDVNQLADDTRVYELELRDISRMNPLTMTCPLFPSRRDAQIIREIYQHVTVFEAEEGVPASGWRFSLSRMLHMADDADYFRTEEQLVAAGAEFDGISWKLPGGDTYRPLYESKLCDQYNHRAATFEGISLQSRFGTHPATREMSVTSLQDPRSLPVPRYWAPQSLAIAWSNGRRLLLGLRNAVSAIADSRSLNACLMPLYPAGHSLVFMSALPGEDVTMLVAMLNSFVVDYVFRQKATGGNASFFLIRQLPALPKAATTVHCPWDRYQRIDEWLRCRVIELSFTSMDMVGLHEQSGPFGFDTERRQLLRAEIDAALFILYGLTSDDASYALDSFKVFERADVERHHEYRTKRVILEIYEAMAEAARTGQPYATRLDPPPADPRVAHPPRTGVIVPFPSRPFVPPAWSHELFAEVAARAQVRLEAGAWGTSLSGVHLGMTALAAVLRNLPGPHAREDVERAVVLALLPRLMLPNFDSTSAKTWRSVIGSENLEVTSIGTFGIPWRAVIRKAIQEKVLAEEADGRWGAGPDVADVPSPEFEARTLVVLAWLATAPAENAEVKRQMEDLHAA